MGEQISLKRETTLKDLNDKLKKCKVERKKQLISMNVVCIYDTQEVTNDEESTESLEWESTSVDMVEKELVQ